MQLELDKRNKRKTKQGVVLSNKMDKTVVIEVEHMMRHPKYPKVVTRRKKLYAHYDGEKPLEEGATVTVMETRPLSKLKRWRVIDENN